MRKYYLNDNKNPNVFYQNEMLYPPEVCFVLIWSYRSITLLVTEADDIFRYLLHHNPLLVKHTCWQPFQQCDLIQKLIIILIGLEQLALAWIWGVITHFWCQNNVFLTKVINLKYSVPGYTSCWFNWSELCVASLIAWGFPVQHSRQYVDFSVPCLVIIQLLLVRLVFVLHVKWGNSWAVSMHNAFINIQ